MEATWREGCLSRLFGRGKPRALNGVLVAVHEGLMREPKVREMRWFATLPADPYGQVAFNLGPYQG